MSKLSDQKQVLGLSLTHTTQLSRPRSDRRPKQGRYPPHVNIVGYPGTYKSTVTKMLAELYRVTWIPRYNTRPARDGEKSGEEYVFITNEEFRKLFHSGKILENSEERTDNTDGSIYLRGTPTPEEWPKPTAGTELILSVFDPVSSPEIKRDFAPEMISICLRGSDIPLLERITKRYSPDLVAGHLKNLRKFRALQIEQDFQDHVIDTDGKTSVEVMYEVIDHARLPISWQKKASP